MYRLTTVRQVLAATTSLSVAAMAAVPALAQSPGDGKYDPGGKAWLAEQHHHLSEAREHAATMRGALVRVADWLRAQQDDQLVTDLVTHLESTGVLPSAFLPFSPFTPDERERYAAIGVQIRICGEHLVSQLVPRGGYIGRQGPAYVRFQGQTAIVTATGIERWNQDPVTDPDVVACGLNAGSPAELRTWHAPALRRSQRRHAESQVLDCPAGEVGSGIIQQRTVQTFVDGFGADKPAETVTGPWTAYSSDCRAPGTGSFAMLFKCQISGGYRSGHPGSIVREFDWREQRDPNDPRAVETIVDWGNPRVTLDFCRGAASEDVDVTTVHDIVSQATACTVFHGAIWNRGGPVGEERDRYTSDVMFPVSWSRPDEQVVALDPWRVTADNCHRYIARTGNGETMTGSCPSGYTGSGRFQTWTENWTWVEYADPVPFSANHELSGSRRRIPTGTESRCTPIPPPGNDGNEQNAGWMGPDGNYYSSRPSDMTVEEAVENGWSYSCPGCNDVGNNRPHGNEYEDDNDDNEGCFLTTAVASRRGEADDGPTLTVLRGFRDGWLSEHPAGQELIAEYYEIAPLIVVAIPATHPEWDLIAGEIDRAAEAIRSGYPDDAFAIYSNMVRRLATVWLVT